MPASAATSASAPALTASVVRAASSTASAPAPAVHRTFEGKSVSSDVPPHRHHLCRWRRRCAMQFQVDAGDSRPTFFELIAADRLVPSLRAALVYSLGVLAARRPGLTRILDHEAEAFAALMLLVETHSFATSDGSLAEGLYGLQRSRRLGGVGGADAGGLAAALAKGGLPSQLGAGNNSPGNNDGGGARIPRRIGRKQRLLSVAMLVGLPYAREKLDALYVRLSGANGMGTQSALGSTIAEAILGEHAPPALPRRSSRDDTTRADDGMGGEDTSGRGNAGGREDAGPSGNGGAQLASSSSSSQLASSRPSRDLRTSAANAFVAAYPWIHAGWEGVVFWCWLRYILAAGETHDPALWLLRLCTTRVSPAEASLRRAATESNRANRLDRMSSPQSSWVNRHVGTRLTRAGYFALDYAQGGLMAAVVGFKLLVSFVFIISVRAIRMN